MAEGKILRELNGKDKEWEGVINGRNISDRALDNPNIFDTINPKEADGRYLKWDGMKKSLYGQ